LLQRPMSHPGERFAAGFAAGRRANPGNDRGARERLLRALLQGAPSEETTSLAQAAHWTLPDELAVANVEVYAGGDLPTQAELGDSLLVGTDHDSVVIVGAPGNVASLRSRAAHAQGLLRLAVSWPVPPTRASDA